MTCGTPVNNVIDKYSYTSDANATDVGDMTYSAQGTHNSRSLTYGYQAGGEPSLVHINKWSFSTDGNATDVADLSIGRGFGDGSASGTYCYWHGGSPPYYSDVIDKSSTSADSNATDVGNLAVARDSEASATSATHGYTGGGMTAGTVKIDMVERYSFASDGNGVDTTQNLTNAQTSPGGHASSTTHGYVAGGYTGSNIRQIQKYQFDTSNNSTNVGNLTAQPVDVRNGAGSSSTTYGYRAGGGPSYRVEIEKWAFASDGDGADVADLTVGRQEFSGTQG